MKSSALIVLALSFFAASASFGYEEGTYNCKVNRKIVITTVTLAPNITAPFMEITFGADNNSSLRGFAAVSKNNAGVEMLHLVTGAGGYTFNGADKTECTKAPAN